MGRGSQNISFLLIVFISSRISLYKARTEHEQARSFLVFPPLISNGGLEAGVQGLEVYPRDGIGRFLRLLGRSC